ncbi:MAG: hypothetical protein LBB39_02035, partial [Mycoplasmataceae bacterium]|nr:hypothetical protein [Mycoplasmataceae bacterium]
MVKNKKPEKSTRKLVPFGKPLEAQIVKKTGNVVVIIINKELNPEMFETGNDKKFDSFLKMYLED